MKLYGAVVGAVLVLASIFGLFVSSRLRSIIATPLSALAQTASTVSETKNYTLRAPKMTNDEMGVLVESFNGMLSGIEQRESDLRGALQGKDAALRDAQNARDSLATTLESIGDAVISTDVEGRILLVNTAAEDLLRSSEEKMMGNSLDVVVQIIDEVSREKIDNPVAAILEGNTLLGVDHAVLVAQDGTETPVEESGAPIRDKSGNVQGTVLVFRDVTYRRKADETSRLLAAIVHSSNDAIITLTLDGMITSWNKGAEDIFGYAAEEVVGRSSAMLAPKGSDEMPAVLNRIGNRERVDQYLATRCTRDETPINVSVTVSPLYDAVGRIIGASAIARDVTEQVRSAERLAALNTDLKRSNDRLARSNEDLERFAFVASHDFQEHLRMISVYSQLLIRSYPTPLDGKAEAFAGNIITGTQRIRELLADLLAYTEVGVKPEETTHTVDLNAVLERIRQNLSAPIAESGANISSDPLPKIKGYEAHFLSLLQNLIANAIKYRSDASPRIHISVERTNDHLQFSIADNGIGIAPEYYEKVFVAFKRLHGKHIPGTGIGLAICQRVAERYGGRIWVESEAGTGSTFRFSLPGDLELS